MLLAHRIQSYIEHNLQTAGHHTVISLAGFSVYVHQTDPGFDANMIFPTTRIAEDANLEMAVQRVRTTCADHQRVPHFHFLDQAAPGLWNYLASAGFRCQTASPVLLATSAFVPELQPRADVSVEILSQSSPLDAIRVTLDVNALGFDPNAPPATDEEAHTFREGLMKSRAFTLRYRDQPVAGGMYTPIHAGMTELVGIATLEGFRRRGFARYLTTYMARAAFQAGAELVFLTAASKEAAHVYTQAGFKSYAERLSYRADPGPGTKETAGLTPHCT